MRAAATDSLKTILTIILGLIVFYTIFKSVYFLYAGFILGAVCLLSSAVAYYIHKAWMLLAKALSYVMPNIVLSMLFYLFLTPIAFIQRLVKKKEGLSLSKTKESTFINTTRTFSQNDFEKPW